jgi:hypothetical protein
MNSLERSALEQEDTINRIEVFVNASDGLELNKIYKVLPRTVHVTVMKVKCADKVISELIELVKISEVDGAFFSRVTVKFSGSSVTKFNVSYHKKVLFFKNTGERVTKDVATYLIKAYFDNKKYRLANTNHKSMSNF